MEAELAELSRAVRFFFNNKFDDAKIVCDELVDKFGKDSLYGTVGHSYISFVYAVFSMEKKLLDDSFERIKKTYEIVNFRRKHHHSLSSWFFKTDYNAYSDMDAHAEIIFGECSLMSVILTFIAEPNFMSIIRAVMKLRSAYNSYKLCGEILNKKTNWESKQLKEEFEVGYKMGWGIYNVLMSHLPTRVLSLLSFVGFSSDRNLGMSYLREITDTKSHIYRHKLTGFMVCFYTFYLEQFFGCGAGDLDWVREITTAALKVTPNSAFDLFWSARYEQLAGNADDAIDKFLKCKNAQSEFKSLHNVCTWDLLWSYAIKCDWASASNCAMFLHENCDWSKATNLYQWACFQYMIMEETNDKSLLGPIEDALESLPNLRRRFIGKTLPPEKFAISKAEKYFSSGKQKMTLPALELFYVWNVYGFSAKNKDILLPLMDRINSKLELPMYSKDSGNEEYYILTLLKGVCLKNYGRYDDAIKCFDDILQSESSIKDVTYIPPHAALEIGLTYLAIERLSEAKKWLEKARDHYTGFLIESMVHLRIHGAMGRIQEITDRQKQKTKGKENFDENSNIL